MRAKLIILAAGLLLECRATAPLDHASKFMGRDVTITEPERDADGFLPKGPASVCLEGPPQRQCYTAPRDFGNHPKVAVIQLDKDTPALLFSAASGGVSGWMIHFALLRPGSGNGLEDLLMWDASVSNQSQHAFWSEPTVSDAQIFLTASCVWGADEGHYGEHRYIISACASHESLYYLEDQYMTVRKYDLEAHANVLASERAELLARLRRLKAGAELRGHKQPSR